MCDKNIDELARKYQAGEELSVLELSKLIRNKDQLPEPMQKQLQQEVRQDEYSFLPTSKSRFERLMQERQKQAG
jgi:hypothetical protein